MIHLPTSMRAQRGMTVLEIMIVLAVVGGLFFIVRTGFRTLTKADLVENANELTAVMRRTSQLAVEHGEMHRLTLDLENHNYVVEVCQGETAIQRNERLDVDEDETQRALERGKQQLTNMPADALAAGDPDTAARRAIAISGHHVADRMCKPATDSLTGDADGKGWQRQLRKEKGIKLKQVWVQHRDDGVIKGQVAIYFFPIGSSEKAVIELTDGSETFSVLVFGLTGRVELRDGALADVEDHMLKNAMGDRDAKREDQR
jgi:prepilin-type N-terminal cleavage/methylation domain-containing protein